MSVIVGFIGNRGAGKTLAMTAALWRAHKKGQTVISNYHLSFPHEALTLEKIRNFKTDNTLQNAAIACDEMHVWFDCRGAMKDKNLLVSYLLAQSRKRNVDWYYTTQHWLQVDVRIRRFTDIIVNVENRGGPQEPWVVMSLLDRGTQKCYQKQILPRQAKKVGGMYDTNQIVQYDL